MFFPAKRQTFIEPYSGARRNTIKFAWLPVTIESYNRVHGTVWLERYTLDEECVSVEPQEVWRKIGTFYPVVD